MRSMAGRSDGSAAGTMLKTRGAIRILLRCRASFDRVPHVKARAPISVLRTATSPATAAEDDTLPYSLISSN
jgi:hypothetical protein